MSFLDPRLDLSQLSAADLIALIQEQIDASVPAIPAGVLSLSNDAVPLVPPPASTISNGQTLVFNTATATFQASFVPSGSIQSDGNVPGAPTTPVLSPGPGFIRAAWDAPAGTEDPLVYDVYLSTTPGFSPSPGTLVVSQVPGTSVVLVADHSGAGLVSGVTYYVAVVATSTLSAFTSPASGDASGQIGGVDGTVLSVTNLSATSIVSGDIAAARMETNLVAAAQATISNLSVITENAGEITAGTFTGTTFQTALAGRRVVIDPTGVTLYDATNPPDILVSIPTDPLGTPSFKGNIVTGGITVTGNLLLQGTTNVMDKGSQLTLHEKPGDPVIPPNIVASYNTLDWDIYNTAVPWNRSSPTLAVFDFTYAPAGGTSTPDAYYAVVSDGVGWYIAEFSSAGTYVRSALVVSGSNAVWGCAADNTNRLLYLVVDNQTDEKVHVWSMTTLTAVATGAAITGTNWSYTRASGGQAAFAYDGTRLVAASYDGSGGGGTARIFRWTVNPSTGNAAFIDNAVLSGGGAGTADQSNNLFILAWDGTYWWIGYRPFNSGDAVFEKYNTSGAYQTGSGFVMNEKAAYATWHTVLGCLIVGISHLSHINQASILNGLAWDHSLGDYWYFAYTWFDSPGPYETAPSPIAQFNAHSIISTKGYPLMYRTVQLFVGALPSYADQYRIYALQSTDPVIGDIAASSLHLQGL